MLRALVHCLDEGISLMTDEFDELRELYV